MRALISGLNMNPQILTDWLNQIADNDDLRILLEQPMDRDTLLELAVQHGLASKPQDLAELSNLSADELFEAMANSRLAVRCLDIA